MGSLHEQVEITFEEANCKISVDSKIGEAVRRVIAAGLNTWTSCEQEGPADKKFPAYINPHGPIKDRIPLTRVGTPAEMAKAVGLKKGQWRQFNGVLWFNPKDVT